MIDAAGYERSVAAARTALAAGSGPSAAWADVRERTDEFHRSLDEGTGGS